jgi:hypothetical protein
LLRRRNKLNQSVKTRMRMKERIHRSLLIFENRSSESFVIFNSATVALSSQRRVPLKVRHHVFQTYFLQIQSLSTTTFLTNCLKKTISSFQIFLSIRTNWFFLMRDFSPLENWW